MKIFFGMFCLLLATAVVFAQDEGDSKGFQKEKLFFGGNFGLTFGDYTLLNLSPQIGYRFNKHTAAGFGINAQYVSVKERLTTGDLYRKASQGVAGLNIFGRVYPIQNIMLQLQPELNYIFGNEKYYVTGDSYKLDAQIIPSLLAGGGLVLPGGRGSFIAAVFYDVLQRKYSPYGSRAVLNFGYNIGF
jgi:hypothetical protein